MFEVSGQIFGFLSIWITKFFVKEKLSFVDRRNNISVFKIWINKNCIDPLELQFATRKTKVVAYTVNPDLVHTLELPFNRICIDEVNGQIELASVGSSRDIWQRQKVDVFEVTKGAIMLFFKRFKIKPPATIHLLK